MTLLGFLIKTVFHFAYLRAKMNTIAIPLSAVFTRISTAALINSLTPSKCGAYLRAELVRVITLIGSLRVYYI